MSGSSDSAVARRSHLLLKARLSAQVDRFDDVVSCMSELVRGAESELTAEERNLLALGFKHVLSVRRATRRRLEELAPRSRDSAAAVEELRERVEAEVAAVCREALSLLLQHALPMSQPELVKWLPERIEAARSFRSRGYESFEAELKQQVEAMLAEEKLVAGIDGRSAENLVFLLKMTADYFRFLAEICVDGDDERREVASQDALGYYLVASAIAKLHLVPTHPARLALALNFSSFYLEIMQKPEHAFKLAESSYDAAVAEFAACDKSLVKDSEYIMQLIKENLRVWTSIDA